MKSFLASILLLVSAIALSGCTNNDDTPRDWFGSWALTALTVDGETPAGFTPNSDVWEFQNDIVRIVRLGLHNELDRSSIGTWQQQPGALWLDFTHSDDTWPEPGTGDYMAPTWLYMPVYQRFKLDIISHDGKSRRLSFTDSQGRLIVYTLHKTW